ncbi:helix-turn-helix transcriptional regulator [Barnesiella sp. An55]|uniref:helix-turn-helix transcriptional regulator n=1 Tax=Barnesiella sp. An55 TaxID=1965646 RepID=UPI000B36E07D|nr:helix-turn-helix transcriptional regulator [Barnesiella sp. An55]OUN71161.1 transcriptional regulator [Barnesiella sp. An55]
MKNRIRAERAELRMTQQALAEATGVSRQTINAIETGRFVLSTILALKIAQVFQKSVEQIFQLEPGD